MKQGGVVRKLWGINPPRGCRKLSGLSGLGLAWSYSFGFGLCLDLSVSVLFSSLLSSVVSGEW